jgi:transposase
MEERSAIKLYFDKAFDEASIIDKLKDLKITRDKVYRTVKRLRETGSTADRPRSGRPRSVRTPELINKVKCRL